MPPHVASTISPSAATAGPATSAFAASAIDNANDRYSVISFLRANSRTKKARVGIYYWHASRARNRYHATSPARVKSARCIGRPAVAPVHTMNGFVEAVRASRAPESVLAKVVESRRSVYAYLPDPVPRAIVDDALRLAMLAPNHHNTRPWRFHVYSGVGRAPLADAYESAAMRLGRDVRKARQRALDAPIMIVVACVRGATHPRAKLREDEFACAAAVQTMLLALAASGVAVALPMTVISPNPPKFIASSVSNRARDTSSASSTSVIATRSARWRSTQPHPRAPCPLGHCVGEITIRRERRAGTERRAVDRRGRAPTIIRRWKCHRPGVCARPRRAATPVLARRTYRGAVCRRR